jgi:hypothetical protein
MEGRNSGLKPGDEGFSSAVDGVEDGGNDDVGRDVMLSGVVMG